MLLVTNFKTVTISLLLKATFYCTYQLPNSRLINEDLLTKHYIPKHRTKEFQIIMLKGAIFYYPDIWKQRKENWQCYTSGPQVYRSLSALCGFSCPATFLGASFPFESSLHFNTTTKNSIAFCWQIRTVKRYLLMFVDLKTSFLPSHFKSELNPRC